MDRTLNREPTPWTPVVRRHRRLQAIGLFVRLSALGTTLAVLLLGAASVAPSLPWGTAAVLVAVAIGFHLFAYLLNDVVDLPIDRHEPRRAISPLVRGTVTPGVTLAVAMAAVPLSVAVAVAGPGGGRAVMALVVAFALMAVYDLGGKRSPVPWLLDLVQGLGWASLLLYGAAARGPWTPLTWWLFAFWTCFIVLANGVHGGLRDLENDAHCGAFSTAIAMGARAGPDGRLVIPPRTIAYGWALHWVVVAIVVGAWMGNDLGYGGLTRSATLVAIVVLAGAGAWALSAAVAAGGEPATLRLAGTLHLLLLMALPVALLIPWLRSGFRAVVVLGFVAPLAGLGWLPDVVRWARHPRRRTPVNPCP